MSTYQKLNLTTGTVLTASHMAHIESGIVSAEALPQANADAIVKSGMTNTSAAAWTSAEQLAAKNRLGIFELSCMTLLSDVTLTEDVTAYTCSLGQTVRNVYARIIFPSVITTNAYVYFTFLDSSNRSMFCGIDVVNSKYYSMLEIAGPSPIVLTSKSNSLGNEKTGSVYFCYPNADRTYDTASTGIQNMQVTRYGTGLPSIPSGTRIIFYGR